MVINRPHHKETYAYLGRPLYTPLLLLLLLSVGVYARLRIHARSTAKYIVYSAVGCSAVYVPLLLTTAHIYIYALRRVSARPIGRRRDDPLWWRGGWQLLSTAITTTSGGPSRRRPPVRGRAVSVATATIGSVAAMLIARNTMMADVYTCLYACIAV